MIVSLASYVIVVRIPHDALTCAALAIAAFGNLEAVIVAVFMTRSAGDSEK
jgi:hypothetical protein